MNDIGEIVKKGGMVAGYHNHNGEFDEKSDGRPQYDLMIERLIPGWLRSVPGNRRHFGI